MKLDKLLPVKKSCNHNERGNNVFVDNPNLRVSFPIRIDFFNITKPCEKILILLQCVWVVEITFCCDWSDVKCALEETLLFEEQMDLQCCAL